MLRELSDRQSEVRELLAALRIPPEGDRSFSKEEVQSAVEQGLAANLGYEDDFVVATVLIAKEMSLRPDSEVTVGDLIWAGAWLDHVDTLGFELCRKKPASM